jgi:hypothetical protein
MSFEIVLNNAVRAGLCRAAPPGKREPFAVEARPLQLRPGINVPAYIRTSRRPSNDLGIGILKAIF